MAFIVEVLTGSGPGIECRQNIERGGDEYRCVCEEVRQRRERLQQLCSYACARAAASLFKSNP